MKSVTIFLGLLCLSITNLVHAADLDETILDETWTEEKGAWNPEGKSTSGFSRKTVVTTVQDEQDKEQDPARYRYVYVFKNLYQVKAALEFAEPTLTHTLDLVAKKVSSSKIINNKIQLDPLETVEISFETRTPPMEVDSEKAPKKTFSISALTQVMNPQYAGGDGVFLTPASKELVISKVVVKFALQSE